MVAVLKDTINTNVKDNTSDELTLTDETVVTLYVITKTGSHNKTRTSLEYSPDGTTWIRDPHSTNGVGLMTTTVAAAKVRAVVVDEENSTATADIHILAR